MRIFSSDDFVRSWRHGEIDWHRHDVVPSPIAIVCPNCRQGVVLACRKGDKKKSLAFIAGDFSLLFPDDMALDDMEQMFNEIVRPSFFQWLENKRKAESEAEKNGESET